MSGSLTSRLDEEDGVVWGSGSHGQGDPPVVGRRPVGGKELAKEEAATRAVDEEVAWPMPRWRGAALVA